MYDVNTVIADTFSSSAPNQRIFEKKRAFSQFFALQSCDKPSRANSRLAVYPFYFITPSIQKIITTDFYPNHRLQKNDSPNYFRELVFD